MKKIYFFPKTNETNAYTKLMQSAFLEASFIKTDSVVAAEYISLNWIEGINSVGRYKSLKEFFKKLMFMLLIIILKKKIIWTFHNYEPHNQVNLNFYNILINIIIKNSNYIIIHSTKSHKIIREIFPSFKGKIIYLPHPNYISAYNMTNEVPKVESQRINLLFIGAVNPYKDLEALIFAFNELEDTSMSLKICGKPSSIDYQKRLEELTISKNIELSLHFIEDEELTGIIQECDIVITPYHTAGMLNSGTHILAFSNAKTIISTRIPALEDIPSNLWFEIENERDMENGILAILKKISEGYTKNEIKNMGDALFSIMVNKNSLEVVSLGIKNQIS